MKNSILLILFFVCGIVQLNSQVIIGPPEPVFRPCASMSNIQQTCNEDGTVTVTFRISNNSRCHANGVTIYNSLGIGQSYLVSIAPLTSSATQFTLIAPAGTLQCYTIILWSGRRECCRSRQCIRIKRCCTLEANVVSTTPTTCAGDDGEAIITMTGGNPNPDYTLEWEHSSGADGYEEYTVQDAANGAELTDLVAGSWQYTVTDQNNCQITGSFFIAGATSIDADVTTTADGCEVGGDGTAQIAVSGGTGPYTGSYSGPMSGNLNGSSPFNLSGLPAGTYYYTIFDSNGCDTSGSFTINEEGVDCNFFDNIYADQDDEDSNENWCSPVYVSSVATTLTITFEAYTVPDAIEVTVEGSTTYMEAGDHYCNFDGPIEEWEDAGGSPSQVTLEIDVDPCDEVQFCVYGDICNLTGTYDPYFMETWVETAWYMDVDCGGGIDSRTFTATRSFTEGQASERSGQGNLRSGASKANALKVSSLKVFPNPVNDILNITNYNSTINYKTVRVFDSAGKTILISDMSNKTVMEIDVNNLELGLYFIEISDETGHSVIEKFVKIK